MKKAIAAALALLLPVSLCDANASGTGTLIIERSIDDLAQDMAAGRVTSEGLVQAYLARIKQMDQAGPKLRALIAVNPNALADARALDQERKAGKVRSPLHGIPILVKDNIETADPMPTTAGSLALARNFTYRDAPLIAKLRASGAVILGKTNMSEWANIRSSRSNSGWSAIGGLVKNPNAFDRTACGSSSGTGAAIAASFGAIGIGTETDGSIVCPSSANGLVGLKPTVGLVSRTHIVPISHSQDGAGPMGRTVADVARLLTHMAGSDPADPATIEADRHVVDFADGLKQTTLKGKRLGILRYATGRAPATDAIFETALSVLKAQGAEIIDLPDFRLPASIGEQEFLVLVTELKADMNAYLASTPSQVTSRTLADLIAFHKSSPREMALFGLETFERAEASKGLDDPTYLQALSAAKRAAGPDGIDKVMTDNRLDALIAPTMPPAWRVDVVAGDHSGGGVSRIAAISGYPHLTLPMGYVRGLPVGFSFIGSAWSDKTLLGLGAAFERAVHAKTPPAYARSTEDLAEAQGDLAPIR